MALPTTRTLRKWFPVAMFVVLVASVGLWYFTREAAPRHVRIATGRKGGLYHRLGESLRTRLEEATGRTVSCVPTQGSEENHTLLVDGKVDLAIIQAECVVGEDVAVITPLHPEPVHLIVRKSSQVEKLAELDPASITLGPRDSGMRASAMAIVEQRGVDPTVLDGTADDYFTKLGTSESLEAAVVTAGVENDDLQQVLGTNRFKLLPITDARAIEMTDPHFRYFEIPKGLYRGEPAVPSEPIPTVATTALLVAGKDVSAVLVDAALASIHETGLRREFPTLIAREEANDWVQLRLHARAYRYFNPQDRTAWLANIMESLAATKELLFALAAGMYLLWHRWNFLKERESQERISAQKERLDEFLEQTLEIEAAQMSTSEPDKLEAYLARVTGIKLEALQEFTEEGLRADRAFSIFLTQCSSLTSKLQSKIITHASKPG